MKIKNNFVPKRKINSWLRWYKNSSGVKYVTHSFIFLEFFLTSKSIVEHYKLNSVRTESKIEINSYKT